jgi:hypothetical protein
LIRLADARIVALGQMARLGDQGIPGLYIRKIEGVGHLGLPVAQDLDRHAFTTVYRGDNGLPLPPGPDVSTVIAAS